VVVVLLLKRTLFLVPSLTLAFQMVCPAASVGLPLLVVSLERLRTPSSPFSLLTLSPPSPSHFLSELHPLACASLSSSALCPLLALSPR